MDDKLMSVEDVAAYLGVPKATIYKWRYESAGPLGYRVGRHVRFRPEDVDRWLSEQRDPDRV